MAIEVPDQDILDIIIKHSKEFGLDPNLVKAIIQKESAFVGFRTRYEPNWKRFVSPLSYAHTMGLSIETECMGQSTSWGLMQVMGAVCREQGFDSYFPQLCLPDLGIYHGCKKLFSLRARYTELNDAIASYNAGHPEWVDPQKSRYINQTYVTDVLRNMQDFKDLK